MPDADFISPADLICLIGTPNCPVLVDVSVDPDFEADPFLIPGAFRHPHTEIEGLIRQIDGAPTIAICQKGGKLSQGLASWLRTEGVAARYLLGGNHAWRDLPNAPRLQATTLPKPVADKTLWVTAAPLDTDRLACAWLVRRFIDRSARIVFVAGSEVAGVTERFGATPFEGFATELAEEGMNFRFASMVTHFDLGCAGLHRISGALEGTISESSGVIAVLKGMQKLHASSEDFANASLVVFDALYQCVRDRGTWRSET